MKPMTNATPTAMDKLQTELHNAKTHENQLMAKNKALKKKVETLAKDLEKEQIHVAELRKANNRQDLHVGNLRKDLQEAKSAIMFLETEKDRKNKESEHTIMHLKTVSKQFEDKFQIEKEWRQQKEVELKKFNDTLEKNKKLTRQRLALQHEVETLKGSKHYGVKEIDRLRELLKNRDEELKKTNTNFSEMKKMNMFYQNEVGRLTLTESQLEMKQEKCKNQAKELEKYEKLNNLYIEERFHNQIKIKNLQSECDHFTKLSKEQENQMSKMQQNIQTLMKESEKHTKETNKQFKFREQLEDQLSRYVELKNKLIDKQNEITKHIESRDPEILQLRKDICDLETRLKMESIQMSNVKAERDLKHKQYIEVLEIIPQKNDKIKQMENIITDKIFEINSKNKKLDMVGNKCASMKKELKRGQSQLDETKLTLETSMKSAKEEQERVEKILAKIVAEKDKLEKELQDNNVLVEQQQTKLNLQANKKNELEQTLKEYETEVKCLRQENKELKQAFENKPTARFLISRSLAGDKKSFLTFLLRKMPDTQCQYPHCWKNQKLLLEKKNEEVKKLKRMLARRPEHAIKMLQRCQWDKRELKEKLEASQGVLMAYQEDSKSLRDEKKKLTDTLRKVKIMECGDISRTKCLSPVSKKSHSPSEDKLKDMGESRIISRSTCFPLILINSERQSREEFKIAPLPPISIKPCVVEEKPGRIQLTQAKALPAIQIRSLPSP